MNSSGYLSDLLLQNANRRGYRQNMSIQNVNGLNARDFVQVWNGNQTVLCRKAVIARRFPPVGLLPRLSCRN